MRALGSLLVLVGLFGFPAVGHATPYEIPALQDFDALYLSDHVVLYENQDYLLTRHDEDSLWDWNYFSYMMFDVGAYVPSGATVTAATVKLCAWYSDPGQAVNNYLVRAAHSNWDETNLSAGIPGRLYGGTAWATTAITAIPDWYQWPVAPTFLGQFEAANLDPGGRITLGLGSAGPVFVYYRSKDYADPSFGPRLIIEATSGRPVPEPASCALLVCAVGGIGAMLRKRRNR